jgi:hypothetical protein
MIGLNKTTPAPIQKIRFLGTRLDKNLGGPTQMDLTEKAILNEQVRCQLTSPTCAPKGDERGTRWGILGFKFWHTMLCSLVDTFHRN